jgi:hypothetical protein
LAKKKTKKKRKKKTFFGRWLFFLFGFGLQDLGLFYDLLLLLGHVSSDDGCGFFFAHTAPSVFQRNPKKNISLRVVMNRSLERALGAISKYSTFVGIGAALVASSLYTVDGGERAVIFDRIQGVKPNVSGEGSHFLIPFIQKPIIFEVRWFIYLAEARN